MSLSAETWSSGIEAQQQVTYSELLLLNQCEACQLDIAQLVLKNLTSLNLMMFGCNRERWLMSSRSTFLSICSTEQAISVPKQTANAAAVQKSCLKPPKPHRVQKNQTKTHLAHMTAHLVLIINQSYKDHSRQHAKPRVVTRRLCRTAATTPYLFPPLDELDSNQLARLLVAHELGDSEVAATNIPYLRAST